ncbi:HNH endonuclease [Desulforhopalus sp. 52FAK]
MSKKYVNKKCVYCNERNSIRQGDHLFARAFFTENERANLIKVPACNECNNIKSRLEHYLTTVIPFGGRHKNAKENLRKNVPPRLNKNKKLHSFMANSRNHLPLDLATGEIGKAMVMPFDGEQYTELFKFILKGLAWYHWGTYVQKETTLFTPALTKFGHELFETHIFSQGKNHQIHNSLGDHAIQYKGLRANDNEQYSIWLFNFYNGFACAESIDETIEISRVVLAISGSESIVSEWLDLFEK